MNEIVDSVLSMNLDVYRQSEIQDPDTGAIIKEFNYNRTMSCYAATSGSGNKQSFSNKYIDDQIIKIQTLERLTPREKITNIRDSENNVIWQEINYPNDTPTVFEITGTTPITDPFGRVIAYNSLLKRSENQQIGQ